jgi:hypothetical protein
MRNTIAAAIAVIAVAACNSVDLDERAPGGFDLSGRWVLNRALSDAPPDPRLLDGRGLIDPSDGRQRRKGPPGGALASVETDFPVISATRLDIEQNADSMGVEYDGADYRDVSWGYRERGIWQIHAGWEEGRLVILSEAKDARAREIVTLTNGGRRMTVNLQVSTNTRDVGVTRVYDRVD